MKRIAITTGDTDGIGLEVTFKALKKIGPQAGVVFYVWCNSNAPRSVQGFKTVAVSTLAEAKALQELSFRHLVLIRSPLKPAEWFVSTVKQCKAKYFSGVVTAPMSKTHIVKAGFGEIGHTEILEKYSGQDNLFMAFLGERFNVLLVTGHLPIKKVCLTKKLLFEACQHAHEFKKLLSPTLKGKPVALVGLNPHAGEDSLIGNEERQIFIPAVRELNRRGLKTVGPLVPDAAFLPGNWQKYSVYVCPYHDQGLIPFKSLNPSHSGVHLTMGLPFVRTSVDHGTAKDIAGRKQADPASMVNALKAATKLVLSRR